jgi:acyl-[acyl-carrier-protein]-phospholipid O-acyltransferase/long-chain-fatty-acid--[acyl-carrier-protein] ligase
MTGEMRRVAFDPAAIHMPLFHALLAARDAYGGATPAIVDVDERVISYDMLVRAALALGHALKAGTSAGEAVGVMLPTGAGAAIAFYAISAYGRVPAMINFTSGLAGVKSALTTAKVTRLVTARRFVDKAGLGDLIAGLDGVTILYLEDVRDQLSLGDKLAAVMGKLAPSLVISRPGASRPAAILFTSGAEGDPKGVALSHAGINANIAQVRAHIDISRQDALFNPLPVFHCFGLTVGTLLPLIAGVKVVCHPTPLQPKEIVRRVHDHRATILLSTDTFLTQYARSAEPDDLASLRLAVCGAERVRDETRALMKRKFGITLLEGYGVTECSPVVAANQVEANRPGTVGKLMTGMEARLEPVEGIADGGRLLVRGPNVMLGYIRPGAPGVIVPPHEGWHDTGDVVSIDEDGFIAIRGRLKRFAKIGGETVSLGVAENCASAVWPDHAHAAVAVADGHKGEQILLVTDAVGAERADLLAWARAHGVSELALPRRILVVDQVPVLGTGKTDYVAVQKMADSSLA